MEKRKLGGTGLSLSIIGFGGFHLVELESRDVTKLLNTYLDKGGNYIETATGYGDGASEIKIGKAVSSRRSEYFLATKTHFRDNKQAALTLEQSLKNLKTDYVDLFFMHSVQTIEDIDAMLAPGGAIAAVEEAKKAGKVRFIAVSGHGRQESMYAGITRYPFDVLMTGFNYLDRFNYPDVEGRLLPEGLRRNIGILGMKAVADGYLQKSWGNAIRYALSFPISSLVLGMNTENQVERNIKLAENFIPMSEEEKISLYINAPELKDYVCRLCGKCKEDGFDPQAVFLLEGLFDRQMDDRRVGDTAEYALRERLRFWFAQNDLARSEYASLKVKVDPGKSYSHLNSRCSYRIDIDRKLKIAHEKLSGEKSIY
ncbi:MAG: aldo/keto reductase [Spirochaetota bacterium]